VPACQIILSRTKKSNSDRWHNCIFYVKAKDDSPADVVFGTVLGTTGDMARGVAYVVRGMADYTRIFEGMAKVYAETRQNLERHVLRHDWTTKKERMRLNKMVDQITMLEKECMRLSVLCEGFVAYLIGGMDKLEKSPIMEEIFSKIELPTEEEDAVDDDADGKDA